MPFAELQADSLTSALILFSWVLSQALTKSSGDAATVPLYEFVCKSFPIRKRTTVTIRMFSAQLFNQQRTNEK